MHWPRICLWIAMLLLTYNVKNIHAQFLVFDEFNFINTTITAAQTIITVSQGVLNLTGLDSSAIGGEFAQELHFLQGVSSEVLALAWSAESLRTQVFALFNLDQAPASATELQQRMWEIRRLIWGAYYQAMRVQALLSTVQSIVQRIGRIYDKIAAVIGNLQGHQNTQAALVQLQQVETMHMANTTAFNRALSTERLAEPLLLQSLDNINEAVMADHPK